MGGLSVAKAINTNLPEINIHYIADHKYLPYGEKSQEFLKNRINTLANYLMHKNCEFIILACHSASAQLDNSKLNFPWLGVVRPTINAILKLPALANIGVIGTNATINSGIYQRIDRKITAIATPELAGLIEEQKLTQNTVNQILAEKLANISHLVLACTHYPLAEHLFTRPGLEIINTPNLCAKTLKSTIRNQQGSGQIIIESTKTNANFLAIAHKLMGNSISYEDASVL